MSSQSAYFLSPELVSLALENKNTPPGDWRHYLSKINKLGLKSTSQNPFTSLWDSEKPFPSGVRSGNLRKSPNTWGSSGKDRKFKQEACVLEEGLGIWRVLEIEQGLQSAKGGRFQQKQTKTRLSQNRKTFVLRPRFRDRLPWVNWREKDRCLVTKKKKKKERPNYQNWDRKWEQGWSWETRSNQGEQLQPDAESLWPGTESAEDWLCDWSPGLGLQMEVQSPHCEPERQRAGT